MPSLANPLPQQHHVDIAGAVDAGDQRVFDVSGPAGARYQAHVSAQVAAVEGLSAKGHQGVQVGQHLAALDIALFDTAQGPGSLPVHTDKLLEPDARRPAVAVVQFTLIIVQAVANPQQMGPGGL